MKTLVKDFFVIAVAVVCLVFGNTAFANNGDDSNPREVKVEGKFAYSLFGQHNSLKIRLNFDNSTNEAVSVKIYDAKNHLVHQERVKQEYLRRAYNVENIGEGVYRVELETGDLKSSSEVIVGNGKVNTDFNAYISQLSDTQRVTVAYQNAKEGAYVTLTDEKETILYSEKTDANEASVRKLDLSHLAKGSYTLRVTSGEKVVSKTYTIQ